MRRDFDCAHCGSPIVIEGLPKDVRLRFVSHVVASVVVWAGLFALMRAARTQASASLDAWFVAYVVGFAAVAGWVRVRWRSRRARRALGPLACPTCHQQTPAPEGSTDGGVFTSMASELAVLWWVLVFPFTLLILVVSALGWLAELAGHGSDPPGPSARPGDPDDSWSDVRDWASAREAEKQRLNDAHDRSQVFQPPPPDKPFKII